MWFIDCFKLSFVLKTLLIDFSTKDTHQLAEANREKNAKIREAFGLSDFYVDGSSLDPNRKHKELEAKAKAMAETKYK